MRNDVLMVSVSGDATNSFDKFIYHGNKKDIMHESVPVDWPGCTSVEHRVGVNVDVFIYHFDGFVVTAVLVWEMYRLEDNYREVLDLADFIGEGIKSEVDAHSEETIWDDDFTEGIIPGACSTVRLEGFETV